ncbi:MAG TPA: tetratricopeptide repeat protein [Noviherbaspirillum sp.]|jgi:hypothetical protein|uniref:SEL1-like repeat protein n=1 Tax=Noviherbaspirillum sp. TaxID=1926288 RepID=UPI002DDD18AA|nr:tetratricopeptide repeat protein [Noviherbaspirillum sp.]HEV2609865.1 tetratricopeptide repeat protein [Noviherbaspirillum sp.]
MQGLSTQALPEAGFEQWETGPYLKGKSFLDNGFPEQAMSIWMTAAQERHAACQNGIGWMYQHGVGIEADLQRALSWYLKAAEQGHPKAMFNTALCYDEGWGTAQEDDASAAVWYERAAAAGYPDAYLNLGLLYLYGYGVDQDLPKANQLFEQAARLGNSDAAYNLGRSCYLGRGCVEDEEAASRWYRLAIEDGHVWASYLQSLLYFDGINGSPPDHDRALPLLYSAANILPEAKNYLANLYEHGDIIEQDMERAFQLYLSAAEDGLGDAMFNVAALFTQGKGIEQDFGSAAYWFERAWDNGDAEAAPHLAFLYSSGGPNLPADVEKGAYWKKIAESEGVE